jgi:integrase/recombinase XerD
MVPGLVVSIRHLRGEDRIEISLRPGFTRKELDVVRGLPGRRYDAQRRIWTVPGAGGAIAILTKAFGAAGVTVVPRSAPTTQGAPEPSSEILRRVGDVLTVRGYSPRTRKVYLGHLRRFLAWYGGDELRLPEDPAREGEAYILELVQRRGISRSYQNQVVSALRFLCESVLGRPRVASKIPRPRKEHRLPAVLSPEEVARILRKTRNPKH